MTYTLTPAKREHTPLILGIAGPTKSGKTYSAHRLAAGIASVSGGQVAMMNAEGKRGHQYADKFNYLKVDLDPPYRATAYTEAFKAVVAAKPAVIIIDSVSHMHDGPGGTLEWHEQEIDRMLGSNNGDYKARERMTFAAWVKPKAAENEFIYALLGCQIPVILCMRAKEKIKVIPGKPPLDLGWQPIVGERVAFETMFTLMLPPHSKGVPDMKMSDMREPFDTMIGAGRQIDESLGKELVAWAIGGGQRPAPTVTPPPALPAAQPPRAEPEAATTPGAASDLDLAEAAASLGTARLEMFWKALGATRQKAIVAHLPGLKAKAADADKEPVT